MTYQRFVALGDSCTEGLDDLLPDGRYRGWADRVASVLDGPGFRYANLGVRGSTRCWWNRSRPHRRWSRTWWCSSAAATT